jgi:N-acetylglucosamine malate deacetylase 1
MRLDVLAVCAHPDDAELHCGGLLLRAGERGAAVGVLDLTRGECATLGTPELRRQEAAAAGRLLGLAVRDNLVLPDGRLCDGPDELARLVDRLRRWRPRLVVTSHWDDHHPDHEACARLVRRACYLAGVGNWPSPGAAHHPEQVLYYLDRIGHRPQLVLDVTDVFDRKTAAVLCFASQFAAAPGAAPADPARPATTAPRPWTTLSSPDYLEGWRARHRYFGSLIGVRYGEGYALRTPVPLLDPLTLLWGRRSPA